MSARWASETSVHSELEFETTALVVAAMTGRSGSTWMMELLGTAPDVVFDRAHPYESLWLGYLLHLARHVDLEPSTSWTLGDMVRGDPERFGPPPFGGGSIDRSTLSKKMVQHLWKAFTECLVETTGCRAHYYVEKFVVEVPKLVEAGVPVKMVRLLRDPRDIVSSILAFDKKRGYYGFGREPGQSEEDYVLWLVGRMKLRLEQMMQPRVGIDACTVRYEDMVRDIYMVAYMLEDWLGISLDPKIAEHEATVSVASTHHRTSLSPSDSVGRWRGSLKQEYVQLIQEELGEKLEEYGYSMTEQLV